jgi:putative transposase
MAIFNPEIHHRQSVRLVGFDYSRPGYYFVTICLNDVRCMLATITVGVQNSVGVQNFDGGHNVGVQNGDGGHNVGVQNFEPLPQPQHLKSPLKIHAHRQHAFQHTLPGSIGSIIRAYKSSVTMWCRQNGFPQFKWQRSFHDHVIRDEKSLFHVRQYIRDNPQKLMAGARNSRFYSGLQAS